MDQDPISDLEDVAAILGLEEIAQVLARHIEPGKGSAANPHSKLIFLAGQWVLGSANTRESAQRSTELCP